MPTDLKWQTQLYQYIRKKDESVFHSIQPEFVNRMSIYRNNFYLNALETFTQMYPVLFKYLGEKKFKKYLYLYLQRHHAKDPNRENWNKNFIFFSRKVISSLPMLELIRFESALFFVTKLSEIKEVDKPLIIQAMIRGNKISLAENIILFKSKITIDQLYETSKYKTSKTFLVLFSKQGSAYYMKISKELYEFLDRLNKEGWSDEKFEKYSTDQLVQFISESARLGLLKKPSFS
ncbi:MAG: DNA-binding domain-containing protein [Oligoflexia bacterium]|nr:DNA-binding domain-containing protein [Oligoflexia bacterium]